MSQAERPYNPQPLDRLRQSLADWTQNEVASSIKHTPESQSEFKTGSGIPLKRVYTAVDIAEMPFEEIGLPGRYPFTRGAYPTMYRGRKWTMRQVAGFGRGADTNRRYKYLVEHGQTGLSTDFDMPTLMGYDSDDPKSYGEVGREGVAIDTIDDAEALFDGIDLTRISTSMTINPTAWILYAMYIALAKKRGYDLNQLSGTIQADILKEYVAQKEWIFPIRPSVRLVRDCIAYSAKHTKRFNPVSISGYHISEAGATPAQEAAFTLANGFVYIEEVLKTGLGIDDFAPRLSFFFVCQADFFEEIAKFRAVRRIYARIMKDRYGAKKPESMRLRFHTQTAAMTLTKPQYMVNIARTAIQALAAVLGGTQSLHTNGMDEAFAIPSENAMKIALRTQQVIADETNVTSVVDPLGGSYFVETLTNQMEQEIYKIFQRIEENGGTIRAVESGWFQREIADSAFEYMQRKTSGEQTVIAVNKYVEEEEEPDLEIHAHDPDTERKQIASLQGVRGQRDNKKVSLLLEKLKVVAKDQSQNIMPITIELVEGRASVGQICNALREVWGIYRETPVF